MRDDQDPGSEPVEEPDPLLEELRSIAALVEPAPAHLVEAGQAVFAWRTVDAELAALVDESLVDLPAAGFRGSDEPLLLTFESAHVVIEVRVTRGESDRELVGQVAAGDAASFPVLPAAVLVEHPGGQVSAETDDHGRFLVGGVAAGPVRLRCQPPRPAPEVVTDWVAL